MHSTHIILVNLTDAIEAMETDDELRETAVAIAEDETERFYPSVFDSRALLEEGEDDDFPVPVVLSKNDQQIFEDYLLQVDQAQKNYAKGLMDRIKANTGSADLSQFLAKIFLSYDRTISMEEIEKNDWEWDVFNDTAWKVNIIADLMHGVYNIDSQFYDTYRGTALVPFLAQLKKTPNDWALVAFNCHS